MTAANISDAALCHLSPPAYCHSGLGGPNGSLRRTRSGGGSSATSAATGAVFGGDGWEFVRLETRFQAVCCCQVRSTVECRAACALPHEYPAGSMTHMHLGTTRAGPAIGASLNGYLMCACAESETTATLLCLQT